MCIKQAFILNFFNLLDSDVRKWVFTVKNLYYFQFSDNPQLLFLVIRRQGGRLCLRTVVLV
jgi:hypothetical protein